MNITDYIKKLRTAANALEDLLDSNPSSNAKAGRGILKGVIKREKEKEVSRAILLQTPKEQMSEVFRQGFNEAAAKRSKKIKEIVRDMEPVKTTMKGYKYKPGHHWTQKPENKSKLAKIIKKMSRKRYEKTKAD